jgi:hypothetical protein
MSYTMSDISLEDKDVIQSIGRRAFLQFTTLDFLISKTYEAIAKIVNDAQDREPLPVPDDKKLVFNNPYQLETSAIEYLALESWENFLSTTHNKKLSERVTTKEKRGGAKDHWRSIAEVLYDYTDFPTHDDHPTLKPEDGMLAIRRIDVFKLYTICIALQRMLSYSVLNPRRMYDFRVEQQLQSAERSSNIYGTQDDVNNEASEYLVEVLRQRILDELKDANSGLPIEEDIKETIVKTVLHTGHLFSDDLERVEKGLEGGVREDVIEDRLVNTLFPMIDLLDPEKPPRAEDQVYLLDVLENSGLKSVIDTLEFTLPDDVFAIANSSVLSRLVNTWGALFTEYQPEAIDLLINMLPTVKDRFRSSVTKSESQQDLNDDAFEVIEEFLDDTLIPIRTNDLDSLLNNPSATSSLYYFRSLRVLMGDGKFNPTPTHPNPTAGGQGPPFWVEQWDAFRDNTARIKFLRLIHWILTDDKELEELIEYALRLKALSPYPHNDGVVVDPTKGHITLHNITVIPGVLFPGTLEMADIIPGGGMLMDMNYAREQKNKQLLKTRLKRSGGLEGAVKDARVRWMP